VGHHGEVFSLYFSPDGRLIASGFSDHTLCIWDMETGHASCCALTAIAIKGYTMATCSTGV
jgi:WD40 repeat protein